MVEVLWDVESYDPTSQHSIMTSTLLLNQIWSDARHIFNMKCGCYKWCEERYITLRYSYVYNATCLKVKEGEYVVGGSHVPMSFLLGFIKRKAYCNVFIESVEKW